MSNQTNPFEPFFQLQRRSIEQTQRSMHQGMAFQKQLTHMMVDGIEAQQSMSRKTNDFARAVMKSSFDAMESSTPGDTPMYADVKAMVDDQFDAVDEMTAQTWTAFEERLEENADAADEYVDRSLEYFDEAVALYLEGLTEAEDTATQITPE